MPPTVPERRTLNPRHAVAGLALPWVLYGAGFAGVMFDLWLFRSGAGFEVPAAVLLIWFYGLGISAGLVAVTLMLHAVWRLIRFRACRRHWSGWVWPVATWLNLCGLTSVAH